MSRKRSTVDASLVAEMLRLTPEERLRHNDRTAATLWELRRALASRARRAKQGLR